MKFTAPAPRLVKALQGTAALSPNTGKRFQIESTLLTVTDTGALEVQATDSADSFWFRVDPVPDKPFIPGKLFVGSANLLRAIKEAAKEEVTIEQMGQYGARISWGEMKVTLPAESVADAPAITRVRPTDPSIQLLTSDFIGLLNRVNFAVSKDFKNRAMAFVRIEVKPKTLRLCATDGVRIASVDVDLEKDPSYVATTYVLPIKPARLKLLVDGDNTVMLKIGLTQDMLSIATPSSEMTIRAGHASWPDFDIDQKVTNPKTVMVKTADLKNLLGGAEMLKVRGETSYEFRWDAKGLEMEAAATVEGTVNAKLLVEWKHDPFKIKLHPGLLWDAVNACEAEQIELSFDTNQQPVKLREAEGNRLYLYALGARH